MRRTGGINIDEAPPTGDGPSGTGCVRIATDQTDIPWSDMPQPYQSDRDWVRGATSLAIGRFEGYIYFETTGGNLDQYLLLSSLQGGLIFVSGEDLEIGLGSTGPWTDADIDVLTPTEQVAVDCDIGCFGSECDPDVEPPTLIINKQGPGDPAGSGIRNPVDDMVTPGTNPFDEWIERVSYLTDIPGGTSPPFTSGSLTGQISGAVASIAFWFDPGAGMGNLRLTVDGITFGNQGTRFLHGETLDHSDSTGQITLDNPMIELTNILIIAP